MTTAHLAYVNARVRARRTRIAQGDTLVRFVSADAPTAVPGWRDLNDDRASDVLSVVYKRLIAEYVFARTVAPEAAPVLVALVRLHEVENLKVVWRALARDRTGGDWLRCWRPLGALETLTADAAQRATSIRSFVEVLRATPYGVVAAAALRAHSVDLEAVELEFDRWCIRQLIASADGLGRRDPLTRALVRSVADERTARLAVRAGRAPVARIQEIRRRRDALSSRAFRGTPYCLAPLVAYLLAREAEARALVSAAELRARTTDVDTTRSVLRAVT